MGVLCAGCDGPQSTLAPAGQGAEDIAQLFWWMLGGAVIVWVIVMAMAIYAICVQPGRHHERRVTTAIIGGGVVFPTVVLTGLLIYGLGLLSSLVTPAPPGSLTVHVTGAQYWWRVRYEGHDGQTVELANELRLPVGEPVEILLDADDVIHAFWVPSLGGKVDMIPGRQTRLKLEPTRVGTYRGQCAEFCGTSHALMSFWVVVTERAEFDAWLADEARPARSPKSASETQGQDVFLKSGCGACHAVRGTPADGVIGPDLTHVGSRVSLGAGILDNETADFRDWLVRPGDIKPEVHMPSFHMLPPGELDALAAYLESLK